MRSMTTYALALRVGAVGIGVLLAASCATASETDGPNEDTGSTSLSVQSGEEVVLDATGLFGTTVTSKRWTQLGGPAIPIPDPTVDVLRFIAPDVSATTEIWIGLFARHSEGTFQVVFTVTVHPPGAVVCGDNVCDPSEDCTSCSGDCCPSMPDPSVMLSFTEDTADIANPERGMMVQRSVWPDMTGTVSTSHDATTRLIWYYIRLDNFRTSPLDATALARIGDAFDQARSAGLKVIVRFTYNFSYGGPDATLTQVLEHIGQVGPVLAAHQDVIAVVQAGFVGSWGEWHTSTNDLTSYANRRAIIDALVAALPTDVLLQLRYPKDKEELFGGPIDSTEAFSGSPASRIGHHNDCFLGDSWSEYGVSDINPAKTFIAAEGQYTAVGGESCAVNEPRTLCPTALPELDQLHWSFLNPSFHPDVLASWQSGGCMDEIRRRLGYRFVLVDANTVDAVRPGGALDLVVRVRNDGFAAPFGERPVFVVLDGPSGRYGAQIGADPRRWEPGVVQTLTVRVRAPQTMPTGTYRLALWLPDKEPALRNQVDYSVRFANESVWDGTTGLNVLTPTLLVDPSASSPDDPTAPELTPL